MEDKNKPVISAEQLIADNKKLETELEENRAQKRARQSDAKSQLEKWEKQHPAWDEQKYEAKRKQVEELASKHGSYKGRMNIYRCEDCQGMMITKDIDCGTTPMFMSCSNWCNPSCSGRMVSYMYKMPPFMIAREGVQFYYPTWTEYKSLPVNRRDHVETFGLIPRRADWIDKNSKEVQ